RFELGLLLFFFALFLLNLARRLLASAILCTLYFFREMPAIHQTSRGRKRVDELCFEEAAQTDIFCLPFGAGLADVDARTVIPFVARVAANHQTGLRASAQAIH